MESKNKTKNKLIDTENRFVIARNVIWGGGLVGETGEGGPKPKKKKKVNSPRI